MQHRMRMAGAPAGLSLKAALLGGALACAAMPAFAERLSFGFPGSAGPTNIPGILALEALEAEGWETEVIEFDSPDIQTQALINGDVDVVSMGPATVFAAAVAGADLRIVSKNNDIDFIILSEAGLNDCSELDGKLVAYHSPGATSTFHLFRYMEDNCPEAEPNYMVLSGSANRATALLNGQIQGTIVRLEDWIAVTGGEDERAKILGVLAETQSDLLTSAFVVSADALEERPEMVEAFLTEVQAQIDAIYADPAAYAEAALPHLEGADLESVTGVFEALAEQEMFPRQMGVSREAIEGTMSFYAASGKLEEGKITADDVADFRFAE